MEIIVDNFAGGGGASTGIEMAIGRSVDIAINHDEVAIKMHKTNHPETKHYIEDVWEVDPTEATQGKSVALAWFSPDCKHFSKAKGGKPVDKNIRGLAWVAVKWAKVVKPRVIMLENVEEFRTWGPLKDGYPDPAKKGQTFELFIKALEKQDYKVDFRELRACDYGAPTTRKRFFMIARCDGKKIIWPEPTHGDPDGLEARCGLLKPWRTAAECIDWSIPCQSIFERKKPLVENTMSRIARGLQKFVIDNPHPFIVQVGKELLAPYLISYHSETTKNEVRGLTLDQPIHTLDTSNRFGLVTAFISKYYAGCSRSIASSLDEGLHTVTARSTHALVTSHLIKFKGDNIGQPVTEPLQTITAGGNHFGEVRAFLLKYYGTGEGQRLNQPLDTITTKDRFGLVTVLGEDYYIADIGMRMLQPHELFKAQGFPEDYIIDRDYTGKSYPKTAQVARVGNSVPPPFAEHLVRANLPELCIGTAIPQLRKVSL